MTPCQTRNIRAVPSTKRDDAWHGQFRPPGTHEWHTVESRYGEIEYTAAHHAENAALLQLKEWIETYY